MKPTLHVARRQASRGRRLCRCIVSLAFAVSAAVGVAPVHAQEKRVPAVTPPRHCICTTEYNPVCGRTPGGVEFTFSNPCRARCVGATVIRRGPC